MRVKAGRARAASRALGRASGKAKDAALLTLARLLRERQDALLEANRADVERARAAGTAGAMLRRLELNEAKIEAMAAGVEQIARLPDPIGEQVAGWRRPNGLQIAQIRVPVGVVAVIYESRPNVTIDVAGLCLKTGNATVLRGGSESLRSNLALWEVLQDALESAGLPRDGVQLIGDPSRELARELMRCRDLIDLLVPRGGGGLIQTVVAESTVPVIETGLGVCHTFVERTADPAMAIDIAVNAKVSNPSVCNAMETLLVDRPIAARVLPDLAAALSRHRVELRGCAETRALVPGIREATEKDWETEYLDLILAIRVVDGVDEALAHIDRYGTRHSEAIVTADLAAARRFCEEVDAACVYVNASTRFSDGFEFGFGAEVGISTQKLHARGPMGLHALTTTKYVIHGDGHVRV